MSTHQIQFNRPWLFGFRFQWYEKYCKRKSTPLSTQNPNQTKKKRLPIDTGITSVPLNLERSWAISDKIISFVAMPVWTTTVSVRYLWFCEKSCGPESHSYCTTTKRKWESRLYRSVTYYWQWKNSSLDAAYKMRFATISAICIYVDSGGMIISLPSDVGRFLSTNSML